MKGSAIWQKIWRKTGFSNKTLWDFLQLLIVPLLILTVTNHLDESANERQRLDADQRYQQDVCDKAFNYISNLILERGLIESNVERSVIRLAKAKILTTLQGIDSKHKRSLIVFLAESGLIQQRPVVHLTEANLRDVDLSGLYLWGKNLSQADLRDANLKKATVNNAYLIRADLRGADMRGASFFRASLENSNMAGADLRGANLLHANLAGTNLIDIKLKEALYSETTIFPTGFDPSRHGALAIIPGADLQGVQLKNAFLREVRLSNANLSDADLESAQLFGADLQGADLSGANLRGAFLKNAKLAGAKLEGANLCRATMPDGSINTKNCQMSSN